jgi:glycosyltransferase involved in cell wall biosynthesis
MKYIVSKSRMENVKRRKVLYISHCSGGGGSPKSLALLLDSLDKNKYEPIVLLEKSAIVEESFKKGKIKTYFRKIISFGVYAYHPKISAMDFFCLFVGFLSNIIAVFRVIKKEKIELVHLNSTVLIISAIASRIAGVRKIVWHIREAIPDNKIGYLEKKLINFIASDIIVMSKDMQMLFDKHKTTLIYNGIDTEEFKLNSDRELIKEEYQLDDKQTIFTHVSKLVPAKGSFISIKALKLITEYGYNAKLFMIGGQTYKNANGVKARIKKIVKYLLRYKTYDWKQELKRLAEELGIADKVIFTGYRNDVPNFMSLSHAIVTPNLQAEGFGRVLIEAGALRKPVISTNIPPNSEIVIDGKTGLLVEPNNPETLAEAMIYIINNPAEARKMGENGYQNVVNNFHIDITHSKIADLYEKILSR